MITNFKIFEKLGNDIVWGMIKNNPEMLLRGVNDGEDINKQNSNGETALIFMAKRIKHEQTTNSDNYEWFIEIIEHGADWNIVDNKGKTFIDYLEDVDVRILRNDFKEKFKEYEIKKDMDKFNI